MSDRTTEAPEAAIEVAAETQYELDGVSIYSSGGRRSATRWSSASEGERDDYRADARKVLEAAVPILTAPLREERDKWRSEFNACRNDRERVQQRFVKAERESTRYEVELIDAEDRADSAERRLEQAREALETAIDDRRRPGAYGTTEAQYFGYAYADRLEAILATLQDSQEDGEGEKPHEGPEIRYGACGVPGCKDCKPEFVEKPGAASTSTPEEEK